jgi:hypothetical protein
MLMMLLDGGAEVHTVVERCDGETEGDLGCYDDTQPRESLWRALATQSKPEIFHQQQQGTIAPGPPRWEVFSSQLAPIGCAIRSRMPSLVRAMLAARPLPTRNSPVALRYLRIACGDARRPSPEILETLLDMANLDHAERTGEIALMILLAFFKGDDFESAVPAHECRCEDDLIRDESEDLTKMVSLLCDAGSPMEQDCFIRAVGSGRA